MNNLPIPNSRTPAKVSIKSVVYVPSISRWALRTEQGYYDLAKNETGKIEGVVADFGGHFGLFVEPESAVSLSYPWERSDAQPKDLAVFEDNRKLIILGFDPRDDVLLALELHSGKPISLSSGDGCALAYGEWRICLRDEDDSSWITVYSHKRETM